jgi:purine-nucleoside phosphorylase
MTAFDEFGRQAGERAPRVFVVLGSGQGLIGARIQDALRLPFAEVPGLPTAHVPGHKGCLTLGTLGGVSVLVSEGRVHGYEGHPHDAVVRTTRLAAQWGVKVALYTNAAGGIRDDLRPGSLMPIGSLLRWNVATPQVLSPRLLSLWDGWPGSYLMLSGPSYETPAEIVALRRVGADAVGMSTVPEALEAGALGMEVGAISLITNKAAGLGGSVDHAEVLSVAKASGERLADLLEAVIAEA